VHVEFAEQFDERSGELLGSSAGERPGSCLFREVSSLASPQLLSSLVLVPLAFVLAFSLCACFSHQFTPSP
jgi:hypothetical protein